MITIIEGADGTGKTTLAQSAAFQDHNYLHCGPSGENPFKEYFQLADGCDSHMPTLFDRFHLGERVYGAAYRGSDRLGAAKMRMLERYLLSRRAVVVHAEPMYGVARHNWRARAERGGEMIKVDQEDTYRHVYTLFGQIAKESALPVVRYDFCDETPETLRERVEAVRPPVNKGPGIGRFERGVTLIVGERCNTNTNANYNVPFVGEQGCSPWLAQQLQDYSIDENTLYWVNAYTPEGEVTHPGFVELLQPSLTIALGSDAAMWCAFAVGADNYVRVSHPQHWRRFNSKKPYPLLQVLHGARS